MQISFLVFLSDASASFSALMKKLSVEDKFHHMSPNVLDRNFSRKLRNHRVHLSKSFASLLCILLLKIDVKWCSTCVSNWILNRTQGAFRFKKSLKRKYVESCDLCHQFLWLHFKFHLFWFKGPAFAVGDVHMCRFLFALRRRRRLGLQRRSFWNQLAKEFAAIFEIW